MNDHCNHLNICVEGLMIYDMAKLISVGIAAGKIDLMLLCQTLADVRHDHFRS